MRVIGYARRNPEEPITEVTEQLTRIQSFCRARDYDLVRTYTDACEGDTMLRPGLQEMLADTAGNPQAGPDKQIHAVVTTTMAVLSTHIVDTWQLLTGELAGDRQIQLVTIDGVMDGDTPAGLVVMRALLGVQG